MCIHMPCLHTSFTYVCIINKTVAYADRPTCNVPPPNPYKAMNSQHTYVTGPAKIDHVGAKIANF